VKEIPRYRMNSQGFANPTTEGEWCYWVDVESLQAELNDVRAKALAAVWSLPEDANHANLHALYEEAREVFLNKDKQAIAKLLDELANAREAYLRAVRPPTPGISSVTGFQNDNRHVGYSLPITSVRDAPNGGLEIEVRLP
jgi:hypothetical protein